MSAGRKHEREDAEEHASHLPKRAKTEDGATETNGDTSVKKEKKEKKDKKDKKEKKDKKKKLKKEAGEDVTPSEAPLPATEQDVPTTSTNDELEPATTKAKKDKKKDKKKNGKAKEITPSTELDALLPEGNDNQAQPTALPKVKKEKKDKKKSKGTESNEPEQAEQAEAVNEHMEEPIKPKKEKKNKKDASTKSAESGAASTQTSNGATDGNSTSNGKGLSPYSYTQTASLSAAPESEIESFLTEKEITISDSTASASEPTLRPILQFSHLPTSTLLLKNPFASFAAPTPIQSASWPFALSGRDVVGVAETGSGKTLAFSLPCVETLASSPRPKQSKKGSVTYARAVIVSPTRELAMQTHAAISSLAVLVGLSAVCIYGGASKDAQRSLLLRNTGADIIVATPGRLKDFLSEGCISLSEATFAVLDEADRMLDKGFEDDIKLILGSCKPREQRQTLMFTATWPTSVRALAETFMVNPVKITIGGRSKGDENGNGGGNGALELQANTRITQKVEVVDPRGKEYRLFELLKEAQKGKNKDDRILVFCLYKKEATRVEQFLERKGIRVVSIHGDLRQEQRTRSLEAFKSGTTSVLVATDVAARGLDIPEVKLVINLTFPLTIEDYVHRIGRTGRAGKQGNAITLFTEHDKAHSGSLINILKAANQEVPDELMKFGTTVKKKAHDAYGAFYKDVDMSVKPKKIVF